MTSIGDKTAADPGRVRPGDTVPAGATPVPSVPGRVSAREPLLKLGRYLAQDELGRGGMGVVYRGHDPGLDRIVALKTLSSALAADAGFHARFISEARALARIEHPNVVHVYDVGEDGGVPFFAMEFVSGRSAEQIVRERGALSVAEAVDLIKQAANGLQAAHAQGIIHRDIKPSNLVLDEKGRVKVLDFGLAKLPGQGPQTATDIIMGTPEYMSPEQGRGEVPDHRSDIYSLGATLYFLLAGSPPFTGESSLAIIHKQVNELAPSINVKRADVPPGVAALLDRLLAKQPAARPKDHAALVAELNALPLAPAMAWPPPFWRWLGRSIVAPSAVVSEVLSSQAAAQVKLMRPHVSRLAWLNAALFLIVTRHPLAALWRYIMIWVVLMLAAAIGRGVARATGHASTLDRHWLAECAVGGHTVFFTMMFSVARGGVWAPIAVMAALRCRSTALYQAGLTTPGARISALAIITLLQIVLLCPR